MFARLLPFCVIAAIIALSLSGMLRDKKSFDGSESINREAPTLSALSFSSYESPTLNSLNGHMVLVNFFASWCGPCEVEMQTLHALPKSLIVYGIAWRDTETALTAWLENKPHAYDYIAMDNKGATSIAYGSTGVPESFLIDKKGHIIMHHAGPLTADIVKSKLLPLLEGVS